MGVGVGSSWLCCLPCLVSFSRQTAEDGAPGDGEHPDHPSALRGEDHLGLQPACLPAARGGDRPDEGARFLGLTRVPPPGGRGHTPTQSFRWYPESRVEQISETAERDS